jgi:hypothetical protein
LRAALDVQMDDGCDCVPSTGAEAEDFADNESRRPPRNPCGEPQLFLRPGTPGLQPPVVRPGLRAAALANTRGEVLLPGDFALT